MPLLRPRKSAYVCLDITLSPPTYLYVISSGSELNMRLYTFITITPLLQWGPAAVLGYSWDPLQMCLRVDKPEIRRLQTVVSFAVEQKNSVYQTLLIRSKDNLYVLSTEDRWIGEKYPNWREMKVNLIS